MTCGHPGESSRPPPQAAPEFDNLASPRAKLDARTLARAVSGASEGRAGVRPRAISPGALSTQQVASTSSRAISVLLPFCYHSPRGARLLPSRRLPAFPVRCPLNLAQQLLSDGTQRKRPPEGGLVPKAHNLPSRLKPLRRLVAIFQSDGVPQARYRRDQAPSWPT